MDKNLNDNCKDTNCICNILKVINKLQECASLEPDKIKDCSFRKLGRECKVITLNTRPIILYTCDGTPFTVQIDQTGEETSSVFRVEKVQDCCAVLRILRPIPDIEEDNFSFVSTNQFITVDTSCFCAIRCLPDTNINENILIREFNLFKDDTLVDSEFFPFGTHYFEAIDANNTEENPSYRMEIELYNVPEPSILNLVSSITVNNPNFVITNYTLVNNNGYAILTIYFTVQTTVANGNINAALVEDTEEQGLFPFSMRNERGLVVNFAFLVTVITIYP
jgi:spore coat protein Z